MSYLPYRHVLCALSTALPLAASACSAKYKLHDLGQVLALQVSLYPSLWIGIISDRLKYIER